MKKNFFKSKLLLLIAILGTNVLVLGQDLNNPNPIPEYIPKSPEAASFQRYGEIPVSNFTGVPEISIPIHTVSLKDLQVPVALSYHAGGITVDQEATIVGLGWTLMAGGSITLNSVGKTETGTYPENFDETVSYIAQNNPADVIATGDEGPQSWGCAPQGDPPVDILVASNAAMGYGEQDIYQVSLPNRSFKFIIHPATGSPYFLGEKNKCKIEKTGVSFFKITDENGAIYLFDEVESGGENHMNNCWYLTSILDVFGNRIDFEYENYGAAQGILKFYERLRVSSAPGPISDGNSRGLSVGGSEINSRYLKSITTNKEKVFFNYSGSRNDLYGAMKLDSVVILDAVSNSRVGKYAFDYGYFSNSSIGGDYLTDTDYSPSQPSSEQKYRLKLETVSIVNPGDDSDFNSYSFTYHEQFNLPIKTSFAKDFWGYYNGQENSSGLYGDIRHTLIPNFRILSYLDDYYEDFVSTNADLDFEECANRFSHPDYIKTATIKSIVYPTGGKTEFEFEPHEFYNRDFISAEDYDVFNPNTSPIAGVTDLNDPYGYPTVKAFSVTQAKTVNLTGGINTGSFPGYDLSSSSVGVVGTSQSFSKMFNFSTGNSINETFTLQPGSYLLVCSAPSSVPFNNYIPIVYADLNNMGLDEGAIADVLNEPSIGGGLRIKSIKNYDSDNTLLTTKEFSYKNENGTSSGKLMKYPLNYKEENAVYATSPGPIVSSFTVKSVLSDNILPVYNSTNGANVTYDRVVVKDVSSTGNTGEEIYYYTNETPWTGPDFYYYNICTNGDLEKKVDLDANNDTVQVESYKYIQSAYEKAWVNIKARDRYYGDNNLCLHSVFGSGIGYRYAITVYAGTNFVNQLDEKETINYDGTKKIIAFTTYEYNSNNFAVKTITNTLSTGGVQSVKYRYPSDLTIGVYPAMTSLNIINVPIEQTSYMNNLVVGSSLKTYKLYSGRYVPDKVYALETTTPLSSFAVYNGSTMDSHYNSSSPEVKFENYDSKGNPTQITGKDGITTSYLWDATGNYLMAKVDGATYSQISSLNGKVCSYSSSTLYSSLKSLVPGAMISSYSYKPLIGLSTVTDQKGVTQKYDYESFGRLHLIKNDDDHIQSSYNYNYKN
ncbi:RHS repeat protein [Draconibacterium mangrovi]|uniref:RHS repeat protein n=1 Tax=Draconibacterium mangrovi TaxID=2697469 RepID=UPI0013D3A8B8|nr:RHS repeat protein [Draconibacterium mangrovi]